MVENKLFVITGGPGAGKTALIEELGKKRFCVVPEAAREIIKDQINSNADALPWKNKSLYAKLMFDASLESYKNIADKISGNVVFFDRGLPDTICYMNMENIFVSDELDSLVNTNPYNKKVFILPPWKEIYRTDSERKQTWKEAVFTFEMMKQTYLKYNYEIIEVPKDTIHKRCEFIISHI